MRPLFDCHCHLLFLPRGGEKEVLADVAGFLSCTVTPDEYAAAEGRFAPFPGVRTAVGLHPWYVAPALDAAIAQADAVCERIAPGSAVGEVGLDFAPRHTHTREAQIATFERIVSRAAEAGDCVLSIHSVQATEAVLDILEESRFFARGTAIFHWYSGSSAHLARALDDGACFSVNPRMLHTKKGREYVRIIPSARLLTETDWPAEDGTLPAPFAEELDRLVCGIAEIRSTDIAELAAILERNSRQSVLPDARKDNA